MKYQGKGKTECRIMAKQRTQRNSTRKNCHPKLFKEKNNDHKDTSKATDRKANKQRKETKAKRESHEAMQNAKQRYERKTKEQSKAPEKQ